jgi:FkbM family methyltransferase
MSTYRNVIPSAIKRWLWRKACNLLSLKRTLNSGYPIQISSYSDWCIYNDLFVENEYDQAIHASFDRKENHGPLEVVDLGANVGFFTLRVLDLLQRRKLKIREKTFLLVEASPSLDLELRQRVGELHEPGLHINIINGLVGEKQGTAQFQIKHSQTGNHVVAIDDRNGKSLEYVNLDTFVSSKSRIDLLKCDIEGSEGAFLRNYADLLQKTQVAIIEFHEPQCGASVGVPQMMATGFIRSHLLLNQGHAQTWFFEREPSSSSC